LSELNEVEFVHARNHFPRPLQVLALAAFLFVITALASGQSSAPASSCADCPVWNRPQQPFRIYGNTYYVGPRGLTSILLTSRAGHILIDGALPESVPQVVANIRSLGFRIEDVKLIVNALRGAGAVSGQTQWSPRTPARNWPSVPTSNYVAGSNLRRAANGVPASVQQGRRAPKLSLHVVSYAALPPLDEV
jgi:hypothetical protein